MKKNVLRTQFIHRFCVVAIALVLLSMGNLQVEATIEKGASQEATKPEFEIKDGVLLKYNGAGGIVTIPDGVKSISGWTFLDSGNNNRPKDIITELIISEGVEKIDSSAFCDLKNLKKVTFPSTLKVIPKFSRCTQLKEVVIPEGVEEIGEFAFSGCVSLERVTLPSTIKKIDRSAFSGCANLKEVMILEGVEEIGELAFCDCTNLEEIILPSTIRRIGRAAFDDCVNLKTLVLPDTLEEVYADSFYNTPWYNAFVQQTKGEYIVCANILLGTKTPLSEINVPEGVVSIAPEVFTQKTYLRKVTLPSTIKDIGDYAFSGCTNLHTVTIKAVENIGVRAFANTAIKRLVLPKGLKRISDGVCYECEKLSVVKLPDGVEEIGKQAFYKTDIKKITFPKSVKKIGISALANCPKLTQVTILNRNAELLYVSSYFGEPNCEETLLGGPRMGWKGVYKDKKTKRIVTVRGYKYSTAQEIVDRQNPIARHLGYKSIKFEAIDTKTTNKILDSVKVPKTITITKKKGKTISVTLPKNVKSVKKFTKNKGQVIVTHSLVDYSDLKVTAKGKVSYTSFVLESGFCNRVVCTTVRLPDGKCKVFTTKVKVK